MRIKILGNKSYIIPKHYNGKYSGAHYLELMRNSKQFTKSKNATRSDRSIRRTIKNIRELLYCNLDNKSYFMTFTYSENLNEYNKSMKRFNYFIYKVKHELNIELKYLAVKELQKRGAIHYHLIVFDIDNNDIAFKILNLWTYGRKHIKKIKNLYPYSIANYLGDYFNDKNQLIKSNKRIFTTSNNLNKPIVIQNHLIKYAMSKEPNTPIEQFDYLNIDSYDLAVFMFGVDKVKLI